MAWNEETQTWTWTAPESPRTSLLGGVQLHAGSREIEAKAITLQSTMIRHEEEKRSIDSKFAMKVNDYNRKIQDVANLLNAINMLLRLFKQDGISIDGVDIAGITSKIATVSDALTQCINLAKQYVEISSEIKTADWVYPSFSSLIDGTNAGTNQAMLQLATIHAANRATNERIAGILGAAKAILNAIKAIDAEFAAKITEIINDVAGIIDYINNVLTVVNNLLTALRAIGPMLTAASSPYGESIAAKLASLQGMLAKIMAVFESLAGILTAMIGDCQDYQKLATQVQADLYPYIQAGWGIVHGGGD